MDIREMLFRGISIGYEENGNWIYGGIVHQTDYYGEKVDRYFIIDGTDTQDYDIGDEYEVDKNTVGQYTGLKDKNKKKIFEHDIVKCYDEMFRKTFIGEVVYRSGSFCIKEAEDDYLYHFRWDDYECEVIGNIYDNPELYVYF